MKDRTASKEQLNSRRAHTVRITITTTVQVHDYLQKLVPLGLYGSSVADVAERLICEALRTDLKARKIALLTPKEESE